MSSGEFQSHDEDDSSIVSSLSQVLPSAFILSNVLEYLPLASILNTRCTCLEFAEATDGLSTETCEKMLLKYLKKKNVTFIQSWGEDFMQEENIFSLFASTNKNTSSPFDCMIWFFRVM